MPIGLRVAVDVLLRLTPLVLIDVFADHIPGTTDDALSVGLAAFSLWVLVASLWGGLDGGLYGFRRLLAIWVPVSVIFGLLAPVWHARGDERTWSYYTSEVADTSLFLCLLILVPALVIGGIAAWAAGRTRPTS